MRKQLSSLLVVLALGSGVAACTGDDDDDAASGTPTPSPSPSGSPSGLSVNVGGTNATAHNGELAMFRLKVGGNNVVYCGTAPVVGGAFSVGTSGLASGTNFGRIELVLNLDGNAIYNQGVDFAYRYSALTLMTNTTLAFDQSALAPEWSGGATEPGGFQWVDGTGCPGE